MSGRIEMKLQKCIERAEKQKQKIEALLTMGQFTLIELSERLSIASKTCGKRIREMLLEGKPIRVVGWNVNGITWTRVYGIGQGEDVKRTKENVLRVIKKEDSKVFFRHDGLDDWLFRAKGIKRNVEI